jgi:TPR repeat protein
MFVTGAYAQGNTACTNFTVAVKDTLNNVKAGLSADNAKWFREKIAKKYPGACYVDPAPGVPVVFYITMTPDTYHGTRIVNHSSTQSNPVDGTITDQNGNISNINGTEQTTTTTSTAVPYSVDYAIYRLFVERRLGDNKFEVVHTFQQKGLYNTVYGIPLGGRGHHPVHALVEDAAKWVNGGGVTDQRQASVQPAESSFGTTTNAKETSQPGAKPPGPRDEAYWTADPPRSQLLDPTLQAKAQAGDASAQFSLGVLYDNGQGVPQDYVQAAQWYRKAAEQGFAAAQYNLAQMYIKGLGVPQDYLEAAQWDRKAAEQGEADAQYVLGLAYSLGNGVPEDITESYFWLDLSASGELHAQERDAVVKFRDMVASHLTSAQLSQVQERASKWFSDHSVPK